MSSIRIISTPPGQAPEEVRKEWIGVVIPLLEQKQKDDVMTRGVVDGKPSFENYGGYQVNGKEAIDRLKEKSPEAAKWWEEKLPHASNMNLVFSKAVCELIP